MAKVNFTKEHYDRMCSMAMKMLLDNGTVTTKLGQPLNIVELLHTTTIGSLNSIRLGLSKNIDNLEGQDEWVSSSDSQARLDGLREKKDLVNLIIGYKRYMMEKSEVEKKRRDLQERLNTLKESQKTPEDKIKELEEELNTLDTPGF